MKQTMKSNDVMFQAWKNRKGNMQWSAWPTDPSRKRFCQHKQHFRTLIHVDNLNKLFGLDEFSM